MDKFNVEIFSTAKHATTGIDIKKVFKKTKMEKVFKKTQENILYRQIGFREGSDRDADGRNERETWGGARDGLRRIP